MSIIGRAVGAVGRVLSRVVGRGGGGYASAAVNPNERRHISRIERAREAAVGELIPLLGGAVDADDALYRDTSQGIRDLPRYTHERQVELAFGMYVTDALAKRIVDMTVDYTVADGIRFEVDPSEAEVEEETEEKRRAAKEKAVAMRDTFGPGGAPPADDDAAAGVVDKAAESFSPVLRDPNFVTSADRDRVGVFLPMPPAIRGEFPTKPEDPSPPHATLLFVGEVTREQFDALAVALQKVADVTPRLDVEMTDYGEFTTAEAGASPKGGQTIAHMIPRIPGIEKLHAALRDAAIRAGVVPAHRPGQFKPHVSLAYMDPGAPAYAGPRPAAAWIADSIELWGFGQEVTLPLRGVANAEAMRAAEMRHGQIAVMAAGGMSVREAVAHVNGLWRSLRAAEALGDDATTGFGGAAKVEPSVAPADATRSTGAKPAVAIEEADEEDDAEPPAEEIEKILDAHWRDVDNAWATKMRDRATGLSIWGEQLWPAFVRPGDGRVRIGSIDPRRIKQVKTDPENQERVIEIELWPLVGAEVGKRYKVITESDADDETRGYLVGNTRGDGYDGACFYFAVNKVQGARRGHSDLFHLIDWIDAYGNLLFDSLDAARLQRSFIYDVILTDATDAQIKKWQAEHGATPRPGTVRVHNQKETWNPASPDLKGTDHAEFARLFRVHILGGAGFPEHWFGEGDSATRATAKEMGAPVLMRLKARRAQFMAHVEMELRFAVDQAILAGKLKGTPRTKDRVKLIAPEFESRDMVAGAAALAQGVTALSVAEDRKWITKDTAREGMVALADHVGIKIDAAVEKAAIEAQEEGNGGSQLDAAHAKNAQTLALLAGAVSGKGTMPVRGGPPPAKMAEAA